MISPAGFRGNRLADADFIGGLAAELKIQADGLAWLLRWWGDWRHPEALAERAKLIKRAKALCYVWALNDNAPCRMPRDELELCRRWYRLAAECLRLVAQVVQAGCNGERIRRVVERAAEAISALQVLTERRNVVDGALDAAHGCLRSVIKEHGFYVTEYMCRDRAADPKRIDAAKREFARLEDEVRQWLGARRETAIQQANGKRREKSGNHHTQRFRTVEEALSEARKDFGDVFTILPDAFDSAEDSPFRRPDDVYDELAKMVPVIGQWKEKNGSLGKSLKQLLREAGVDVHDISQTAETRYGEDYTFLYKGEKRLFRLHVTLGAKNPNTCLSIHFYFDEEEYKVVVGWCGRHRRNTMS